MIISKVKFFIQKRFMPIAKIKWEIKSTRWGYRKKKYATQYLASGWRKAYYPIDLQGKQHIHIYPKIECNYDCYFCQNKFYVDKLPKYEFCLGEKWASWLNRMYNFHHIDWNGGEPMLYADFVILLNSLYRHNIVIFTNLPHTRLHILNQVNTKRNNIMLCVSYHPLEEKRDISQFVADFKQIPKGFNATCHVINIPEISYKNIRAAFVKRGVFIEGLDAIVPTKHNKIQEPFKTVMCNSDMDCIAPDLSVYPCTGLMLRKINGVRIAEYEFSNDHKQCDYYGLCGPCTSGKDIKCID